MLLAILTIVGAAVGAIVGVLVQKRLQRAKPQILVDSLRISLDAIPVNALATVNRDLMIKIGESAYRLGNPEEAPTFGTVSQADYVSYLKGVSDTIDATLNFSIPHLAAVAQQLADYLGTDALDQFEAFWAQESNSIWLTLEGSFVRGRFQFKCEVPEGAPQYRDIVDLTDGNLSLYIPAARNIIFPWTIRQGPARKVSREFARQVAAALAYRLREPLQQLVNFLRGASQPNIDPLKSLQDEVQRELSHFKRLNASGVIGNAGQSPLSVLNRAELLVNLAGYQYNTHKQTAGSKNGHDVTVSDDIPILLYVGRSGGDIAQPIAIEAGGMTRFQAVGRRVVDELPHSEGLASAFTGGERTCSLALEVVCAGREGVVHVRSRSLKFRAIVDEGAESVTVVSV